MSEEEEVLTAKDPKKVEQGGRLGKMSVQYKKEKARKMFMEEDDEKLCDHFVSKAEKELRQKFLDENFSYIPYVLYPITAISTFAFLVMLFRKSSVEHKVTEKRKAQTMHKNHHHNSRTKISMKH